MSVSQASAGLFDLHGRVGLITGATGGLGRALAGAFAAQGATLVLADRDLAACDTLAAELARESTQAVHTCACDLSRRDSAERLIDFMLERCGRIDTMVLNAGIQGPAGALAAVAEEQWDEVMALNLKSAWWLTSRALPAMAPGGSVVMMSSIAGLRGNGAIGLYGTSKAALAQLARNLAVEWGPRGIRVNAISPGLIRTPLAQRLLDDPAFMARRMAATPLRRPGEPHEVAGVAVMLASRAGAFINGQNIVIDGGTTIGDGS